MQKTLPVARSASMELQERWTVRQVSVTAPMLQKYLPLTEFEALPTSLKWKQLANRV